MSPAWLASLTHAPQGQRPGLGGREGRVGWLGAASEAPPSSSRHAGTCSARCLRARRGVDGGPGLVWKKFRRALVAAAPEGQPPHGTGTQLLRPALPAPPEPDAQSGAGFCAVRPMGAGTGRPRRGAQGGGCFKMADAEVPSRPGAAAFWSRDCIFCPPGRARRRLSRCYERLRGILRGGEKLGANPGGPVRPLSGCRAFSLLGC